jgi:predicted nucleic acid-binding protein
MDFETLQKNYGDKFIALLNKEKVVASGRTFNEVYEKIKYMKLQNQEGLSIQFVRPVKVV